MNSIVFIKEHMLSLIGEHFQLTQEQLAPIYVNINLEPGHGDFSCNAALVLSKHLGRKPHDIAQEIIDLLCNKLTNQEYDNFEAKHIKDAQIAGPGFVNVWLTEQTWRSAAHELAVHADTCFKLSEEETKLKYLIEFVSCNPTGPVSLGHGRNAIIGDTLARVLSFLGHSVTREFYINDAGQQVQKLGHALQSKVLAQLAPEKLAADQEEIEYDNPYMDDLANRKIAQRKADDLIAMSHEKFVNLAKEHFLNQIKADLAAYGIKFDNWFSEMDLHNQHLVEQAIEELKNRGFCYEKDGATWFKATEYGDDKDRVLKKSDGTFAYIAPDVAYHQDKFRRGFDVIVDIIGQDHHSFAQRLPACLHALGYDTTKLHIILYQLVCLKQGEELVRMSKRLGTFIALRDVIESIGVDCARYFYLDRKYDAHLELDLDTALKHNDENPVYYIGYAYVRTRGLLEKAKLVAPIKDYVEKLIQRNINEVDTKALEHDFNQSEIDLLKKVFSLNSILKGVAQRYQVHSLAHFTRELAQTFHAYYNQNIIIDPEHLEITRSRLLLVDIIRNTLGLCLDLLGLSKPVKM